MAKIIDGDDLVVGTNLALDTTAKTFTLSVGGALTSAKEGVTLQALYSKFIKLWETAAYNKFPFPCYAIDALSGQFQFGTDGGSFNGWKPADDTTRQMLRDGGWDEYLANGTKDRTYVGMVALASGFPSGAQFYYQKESGGAATNFTFDDAPNEGIRVDDTAQTFFKIFCREPNYTYDDAVLGDVGSSATGPYKISLPISVGTDLKTYSSGSPILDTAMSGAPYISLGLEYFGSDQTTYDIGAYPFRIVIDNTTANATLEQIYTWVQYKLRQAGDIDDGAGTVAGKTANSLMYFVGDTLYTTTGVFIDGVLPADLNRVVFRDQNDADRIYPYAAAGTMNFNSFLTSGGTGYYIMYFANDDAGDNTGRDYGTSTAIVVNDKDGNPIQGAITAASIPFSYDYTNNVQRGTGSNGDDAPVVLVAGNKGVAKPVVVTGVSITQSKSITLTATAEQDRAYVA
jgi:hypothetical protein